LLESDAVCQRHIKMFVDFDDVKIYNA